MDLFDAVSHIQWTKSQNDEIIVFYQGKCRARLNFIIFLISIFISN